MSRTYRGENSSNYYFGYLSNPGGATRPMSAGAGRSRSTSRGSINNLGSNPIAANVLTDSDKQTAAPTLSTSSSNNIRPSSSGYTRTSSHATSSSSATGHHHPSSTEILYQALQHSQQQQNNHAGPNLTAIPLSIGATGANILSASNDYRQASTSRPRSAGPSRRPHAQANDQNTSPAMNIQDQYRQTQDFISKNPLLTTKYQVPTPTGPAITFVKPAPTTLLASSHQVGANSSSSNSNVILSGNNNIATGYNYKPGYNYPNIATIPINTAIKTTNTSPTAVDADANKNKALASSLSPLANYVQVRPSSASATSRIRQAINDSQKILPITTMNLPAVHVSSNPITPSNMLASSKAGYIADDDGEGDVVGDLNGDKRTVNTDEEDDNEMDGKPFSRSHPEVSLTTPSQSLELGYHPVGTNTIDIRNSSIDSLQDEDVDVGLSTLPNQFCTKRDAAELKKLIMMGNNDHGGIVPSSSALMDVYMVGKVIGVGSYGKVRVAWHRLTGAKVAIKTYDKSKMKDQAHWKRVYAEIKIMEQISHPRISRLYEAVETPKRMHLIMECLDGGNLCSYVKQKKRLSEDESKRIFFQILQAIDYLHSYGITHRDIKLENVLFAGNGGAGAEIKLIDFGFSTVCQPGKRLKVFCGTPSYMAPEIVRRLEYEGKAVDMWSLGILLYALLCGCFPFRAKTYPDLYRRIARGTFLIPEELSSPVKDMIRNLLNVDASERLTSSASLKHVWLTMQYANASDLNKMRRDTAILISDKPSDDIDEQVLCEMEKYGIPKDEIIRVILTKTHTAIATLYYLLLDNVLSKRKLNGTSSNHNTSSSLNGKYAARPNTGHNHMQRSNTGKSPHYHTGATNDTLATHYQQQQHQPQAYANIPSHAQQPMLLAGNGMGAGHGVGVSYNMSNAISQQQQQQQRPRSASAGRSSTGRPLISFLGQR